MPEKIEAIINILMQAVQKEQEAFNYYYYASERATLPEVKSLLIQLAEREREHRRILIHEIQGLRSLVFPTDAPRDSERNWVGYKLPMEFPFKRLHTIPQIDLAAVSFPTRFVGGDYIDSFPLTTIAGGDQHVLGLLLCDAKGHGFDASYVKAVTSRVVGQGVEAPGSKPEAILNLWKPSFVVTTLNRSLYEVYQSYLTFASVFYCVIHPAAEELIYTSAGHEPPVLIRKHGNSSLLLSETELLVGLDQDKKYSEKKMPFRPGDILVLFTDGIVEATNSKERMYGRNRLIKILHDDTNLSAREIVKKIIASVHAFVQENLLQDEMSLIVAKFVE